MKCSQLCSKCDSSQELTLHHCHPVVWYGRKDNTIKVCLCIKCHHKLEMNILAVEGFVGNVKFGQRVRLPEEAYDRILRSFLGNREIIYVAV